MPNSTRGSLVAQERLTDKEVKQLLEKVREFQNTNQKYLINPITPNQSEELSIINMANTDF